MMIFYAEGRKELSNMLCTACAAARNNSTVPAPVRELKNKQQQKSSS